MHFAHLTMQVKSAASETSTKPQAVFLPDTITIPPMTTKTITAFVQHQSEWNTTGTVTTVGIFTEAVILLISHSVSTKFNKKIAVRVTNTRESRQSIGENTQIVELSVVTLEQPKFIKSVDTATLNMIPEDDLDLTTYLTSTSYSEQINQISRTTPFGLRHLLILA